MSFPRAKIHRFNESFNPTPSPADYNVASKTHVTGAAIPKSDRFVDRSPASSEHGSQVSSGPGLFRTPSIPRKLRVQPSSADSKVKLFRNSVDIKEQLKEKTVECSNKDQTIREFIDQIEEYKQSLNVVNSELSQFKINYEQLQDELQKLELEKTTSVEIVQEKYKKYVYCLREKSKSLSQMMEELRSQYEELKEKNKNDLRGFLNELECLQKMNGEIIRLYEEKLSLTQKKLSIRDIEFEQIQLEVHGLQEIEKELRSEHEFRVQELECKLQENLVQVESSREELIRCKREFEIEKQQIFDDSKAKVEQLTENYKDASLLAEMQMEARCRDIEDNWRLKLDEKTRKNNAILKECQDIAEYNIIQCELEKNRALSQLGEAKSKCEELEQTNTKLNDTLSSTVGELSELKEQQNALKENMVQVLKDKHLYEMTINKTHKTVEALKQRLMKSDKDVEQLKAELDATETSKLEYEGKCNQMTYELEIVCGLCDDKEEQSCLALQLCQQRVAELEQELRDKVDSYKEEASKEVDIATNKLEQTKADLNEAMEQLRNQQGLINEFENLISKLDLDKYENEMKKYKNLDCKYNAVLDELNLLKNENAKLKQENELQELLIGPFRNQLEAYDMEYKVLMNEKQGVEREAKEMGLKYAELLGHQNQKQKIKHLTDLKTKNYELLEGKMELEKIVRKQTRTIENLKKELNAVSMKSPKLTRTQALENKENVKSPNCNRSLINVFSPGGGPLKERN